MQREEGTESERGGKERKKQRDIKRKRYRERE